MKQVSANKSGEFTDSSGKLARDSLVSIPTISSYAAKGLLDFVTCSNGHRMFRAGQAPKVRKIYRQRMEAMGRDLGCEQDDK
jgi:DNA-binding transcriptional MerR regulator